MAYHTFKNTCQQCAGTGYSGTLRPEPDPMTGDLQEHCQACKGAGTQEHGSFEVYHQSPACEEHGGAVEFAQGDCHECAMMSGWYWRACFPGCMPDSEPFGPFESEQAVIEDAQDGES